MPSDDETRDRLEQAVLRLEAQARRRLRAAEGDLDEAEAHAQEWVEFLADHPELTERNDSG